MDDFKSDTAKLIQSFMIGVLIIVCVLAVLGALFGVPYMIASGNNQKVQNLTNMCISQGYDGWKDGYVNDDRDATMSGCYNAE